MASKGTDKTLWTVALIGAFAFAAWKLLPILARKLGSGGGSGSGGAQGGVSGGSPYGGQQGSGSGSGGFSGGPGLGSGNQNGSSGSLLSNFINSVQQQGWANALGLGNADDLEASDAGDLYSLDNQGLPLDPNDNESFGSYIGSDFFVTQDVPGSDTTNYDTSGFGNDFGGYDTGSGDQTGTDDGDGYDTSGFGNNYGGEDIPGSEYDPNVAYSS